MIGSVPTLKKKKPPDISPTPRENDLKMEKIEILSRDDPQNQLGGVVEH